MEYLTAQDKICPIACLDFISSYVWRGGKCDGVSIQPTLGFSYKGLSFKVWGTHGLTNNPFVEIDWYLQYQLQGFVVGLNDYWLDNGDFKYFDYESHKTSHTFEAYVGYDWKFLSVYWYTNFAGADGLTSKGKRAYTSYFEVLVPFTFITLDWEASLGCVPYSSEGGYYVTNGRGFSVVNLSLLARKSLKISDKLSLDINSSLISNPSTKSLFFVAGLSLVFGGT